MHNSILDPIRQSRGVQSSLMTEALQKHANAANAVFRQQLESWVHRAQDIGARTPKDSNTLIEAAIDYARDSAERSILTLDALRKRGDMMLSHDAAGQPPVLVYDYDVVLDAATLPRPCNYMLLRIKPKHGEVLEFKRPYVIIDPRAGHGAGIGGFKEDSQVGVALADGHPVYFVAFHPMPIPGQTIADVTRAEAAFLREVRRRHPQSPNPVVIGNCQGGWATAVLAATNPDLVGPIVLNGAPMSYWSGRLGQDPMRYIGGTSGGVLPVAILSDLDGGLFDGANLVMNFEMLNPGRTWFRKYFDLYSGIDKGDAAFLNFERWWSGFVTLTDAEIRWIVENLFVGNKLGKNEARLETGQPIDLKAIRAPVIVFASHGDNITPPQQALNWIVDTYTDESEIAIRGQRIIYMVHEEVGHLGIFVSSSVAKREHTEMASTLKTIEALSPGLYEMVINDVVGEGMEKSFSVSFERRTTRDILALDDRRKEEAGFAAVARMSETVTGLYDLTARPIVQAIGSATSPALRRNLHPMRAKRLITASTNPVMAQVAHIAEETRRNRRPAQTDNPFLLAEALWADMIEAGWNALRDFRSMALEVGFITTYTTPYAVWFGAPHAAHRSLPTAEDLRALPEVQHALDGVRRGHLPEAIVRMLILLASTRNNVRADRLNRASEVLNKRPPFDKIDAAARSRLVHEQTLIVRYEPEAAMQALPHLVPRRADREQALAIVEYVLGAESEMERETLDKLHAMRDLLHHAQASEPPASEGVVPPAPSAGASIEPLPEGVPVGQAARRNKAAAKPA
jgi:pimeloyl-ACP methyl ester carboxylesterase